MTVITARIQVAEDGTISGRAPDGIRPGEHLVRIEVAEQPGRQLPTMPFNVDELPTIDLGPWPEGLSLRREDMYGDDGR